VTVSAAARIVLDRDFTIGEVPRRLFGSFVEHMGRCVYTGVYEPGHPTADARGFRGDVLELVRELGPTVVRYPGGNFVSGYAWEDGIGPVADRPRRLDAAWHSVETNAFGLHEFMDWAGAAGVEPMYAVNLGTRGVDDARRLVEYANHPGGTALSDLRAANGAPDPFGIRLWCLGNELDGPWQLGARTAAEYGRLANETAKAMRMVDDAIELVAVGSSGSGMPTFGEWERVVLEHCYDEVDYLSLHAYYQEEDGDVGSFLATALDMDAVIESVVAVADGVRARGRHGKRMMLSFDEWNVWYRLGRDGPDQLRHVTASWREHPALIEDRYGVADAVVVGTMLNSLLRHSDRVRIANQAQLVNVIAPIRTDEGGAAWRQSIFWPFARMAAHARGRVLRASVVSDRYATARFGDADLVDVAATWSEEDGRVTLFLANRGLEDGADVHIVLRGFDAVGVGLAEVLDVPEGGDRSTANDVGAERVGMRRLDAVDLADGAVRVRLPALSWAVVEIAVLAA
jgi:alpha-L-arabinofuranosidase